MAQTEAAAVLWHLGREGCCLLLKENCFDSCLVRSAMARSRPGAPDRLVSESSPCSYLRGDLMAEVLKASEG